MNKLKQMHFALFLTIITSLCLVFPPIFIKLLMNEISPIGTLTLRFLIAAPLFPLILLLYKPKKAKLILNTNQDELKHFALLALAFCLCATLYFVSFYFIPANQAMLLFLMYPVFDSLLAMIFLIA